MWVCGISALKRFSLNDLMRFFKEKFCIILFSKKDYPLNRRKKKCLYKYYLYPKKDCHLMNCEILV